MKCAEHLSIYTYIYPSISYISSSLLSPDGVVRMKERRRIGGRRWTGGGPEQEETDEGGDEVEEKEVEEQRLSVAILAEGKIVRQAPS